MRHTFVANTIIVNYNTTLTLENLQFDELSGNVESLQISYEELIKKYESLKCNKCEQSFNSQPELNKHIQRDHKLDGNQFQCNVCNINFSDKDKLQLHLKSHNQYSCDHCDKKLKYEHLKTKHTTATHKNVKLYCHYFNNKKNCPFADQCIFLHEDSDYCKYRNVC